MSHSQDAEARRRTPFPVSIHLPEGKHFLRGVPGLEITKCFVRRQWSAGQRLRYQNWTGGVCTERWTIRRLTLKKERFLFFLLCAEAPCNQTLGDSWDSTTKARENVLWRTTRLPGAALSRGIAGSHQKHSNHWRAMLGQESKLPRRGSSVCS